MIAMELDPVEHRPIDRLTLIKYAAASGDFNPIHWDDAAAREMGLDGVIAHGMLSMGLLGNFVRSVASGAHTRRLSVRFKSMVLLGDVLTCRGRIREETEEARHLDVWVEKQDGTVVVTGEAELTR